MAMPHRLFIANVMRRHGGKRYRDVQLLSHIAQLVVRYIWQTTINFAMKASR